MAEFRSTTKAVTRAGQIKERDRHEKDDRRRIDDRREYVLGWSNEAKIETLIDHGTAIHHRVSAVEQQVQELRKKKPEWPKASFPWQPWPCISDGTRSIGRRSSIEIATLEEERRRILRASDRLSALTAELASDPESISGSEARQRQLRSRREASQTSRSLRRESWSGSGLSSPATQHRTYRPTSEKPSRPSLTMMTTAPETRRRWPGLSRPSTRSSPVNTRKPSQLKTVSVDGDRGDGGVPSPVSAGDHRCGRLGRSGRRVPGAAPAGGPGRPPRFEREFKDYLNQNTIRDIAGFAAQLTATNGISETGSRRSTSLSRTSTTTRADTSV